MQSNNLAPEVSGYYKRAEVHFIHTEASDPQVAGMPTRMMGPPVALVPSLAQAPRSVLATVHAP